MSISPTTQSKGIKMPSAKFEASVAAGAHKALCALWQIGPVRPRDGLALNVVQMLLRNGRLRAYEAAEHIQYVSTLWPEFSGNLFFPIPDPNGEVDEIQAHLSNEIWTKPGAVSTKYQDYNRSLLKFLLEHFQHLDASWWCFHE